MPEKVYAVIMALSNAVQGNPTTVTQKAVNQIAIINLFADIAATNTALLDQSI